jgi:hypothetical protein
MRFTRPILGLILRDKFRMLRSPAFGRTVSEIWRNNEQYERVNFSHERVIKSQTLLGRIRIEIRNYDN